MKILIIDDVQDLADLLKMQIETDSIKVDVAYDGEEGLKLINTNSYDLILSDNHMPKLTGLELLEKIEHKNFYIISGNTDLKEEVLSLGGKGLINKPFNISEIENILGDIK